MKSLSRAWLFATPWIVACTKLLHPLDFQGKSTGVGCHFLLQGIFPTQGSNPGLSHCRQMLYHLSQSEGRQNENHNHRKLTKLITWTTALSNSMKLWALPCRATQDGWVMVESSDKTWSTGEWNGKALQYSCLENSTNSMKRHKDRTLKDELPRLVGAQYATREE